MNFGKLKKGKLALMCMAAAVAVSMSACGDSKADQETQETEQTMQTAEQESTDSTPSTEQERVGDREDYVGLQDLEIEDYVTLPDYTDMKVSAARPAVDDGTVEQYIDSELLVGTIMDRAVQEGDVTDIDFVGKKDGVAFDGGTASGYRLTIGSGGVIPGFEAGLVGVMPGETVDLELTFPESYDPNPDLAGQEVVFTVTVNGIEGSAQYGTVTPEEMESLGLPYRTKEEVWEAGKKAVEQKADETFEANAKSAVVQKLVEESGFQSIPEYLVEEETGMSGLTREEYDSQVNEMCTEIVKQYMVMEAVARAEGIEITDEMIHGQADGEAAEYGYASGDELISDVGFTTYRMSIVQDKVIGRLMEVVPVGEEETQQAADS